MTTLDIERIVDTVVGIFIGIMLMIGVVIVYHHFNPHFCSSPKAYELRHEAKTSEGYYRYELHRWNSPVGMVWSSDAIEHGFMIRTDN